MDNNFFEEEEFVTQFNGQVIGRILQQARPYWKHVTVFLLLISTVAIFDAFFTYLGKLIIDEAIVPRDKVRLMQLITLYGSMLLIQAGSVFGFVFLAGSLGQRLEYDLRRKMFNHLQSLSLSYFDRTPIGWIMSRVTSDSARIAELVTWGLINIVWAILNLTTAMTFMFIINWRLASIIMVVLPVLVTIAIYFKKKILVQFRLVRKLNSKLTGVFNENITGVRVVKALTREEQNLKEFDHLATNLYQAGYRAAWLSALFLPMVQLVGAMALGTVIWYAGGQIQVGGMTVGGLQAFVSYLTIMLFPIQDLARAYADMQSSVASAERVFSLIDAQPEIFDRPEAIDPDTIHGEIEFNHVDFYYDKETPVLTDFNLKIKSGEMIALVGPTGGGKSTIVNLICRFQEPRHGVIRFDNVDYTNLTLHAIQSRIGMVLQTPHLFSGTIRENIRYGRLEATNEEVEAAAKLVHADEFISQMEKGYDEPVGENGSLISTGQKQLLSLARAVLANPRIMIMDEATSSVDTLTESLIQQGLEATLLGRTSFVVAHRLSTIKKAHRILVIEDGRIVEMGSHAQLIRAKGFYYSLYTKQFSHDLELKMKQI